MKRFVIALSLIAIHLKQTISQNMNRPNHHWPNTMISRPETIIEPPRAFISQPLTTPYAIDYTLQIPPKVTAPSTTLVTDCTPSVCKNLANTLQLMIVCNLLQNQKGGSELAMQLASPFLNDVIASPSLSCGCPNPLYSNSPIITASYPNVQQRIARANTIAAPNSCPNSGLLNILGLISK